MLTIRMQRTGRSGHAQYRVIVQDSRFTPTSGRVVAYLGSYNPHTKEAVINSETTSKYLSNGAQPSERVARLLSAQGVKLPEWVAKPANKERSIRNVEKLRRNRPPEAKQPETEAEPAPETSTSESETTAPVEPETVEAPTETANAPTEEIVEEAPESAEVETEPEVEVSTEPAADETPKEPAPKDK